MKDRSGRGIVFVVTGPSGSGKTTLRDKLLADKKLKKRFAKSVSLTTRPKRPGERHGRDYIFITEAEFNRRKRAKKILEWTRYLRYYYATPKDFIDGQLKRNKHIILCLDSRGASYIKKAYPDNSVTVFIAPPSIPELKNRILGRCKTAEAEIKRRLALARKELKGINRFDYPVINKNLAQAAKELKGIVLKETGIK